MIKQLFIKLGLWEEKKPVEMVQALDLSQNEVVTADWYKEACRHYCEPCKRWFSDVRGKLMHDRHRHKNE